MTDQEKAQLAYHAGFAMQAAMICGDLKWLYPTERELEARIGEKLRGPESRFSGRFIKGCEDALTVSDRGVLQDEAWQRYGDYGRDYPGLVHVNMINVADEEFRRKGE